MKQKQAFSLERWMVLVLGFMTIALLVTPLSGFQSFWRLIIAGALFLAVCSLLFAVLNRQHVYYYLTAGVVIYGLALLSGTSFFVTLLMIGLLFWMFLNILGEQDFRGKMMFYFVIAVSAACLYYAFLPLFMDGVGRSLFFFLVPIGELLLIILYNTFWRLGKKNSPGLGIYSSLLAAGLIFSAIVLALKPVIAAVISYVGAAVSFIGFMISWVLFKILELMESHNPDEQNQNTITNEERPKFPKSEVNDYHIFKLILIIILIIIAIVLFIYLRKKLLRLGSALVTVNTDTASLGTASSMNSAKTGRLFAPKTPVRLAVFQMQKRLKKLGHPRFKGQTFRDWTEELPATSDEKTTLTAVYDKVRYSGSAVSQDEVREFKRICKQVAEKAKELKSQA